MGGEEILNAAQAAGHRGTQQRIKIEPEHLSAAVINFSQASAEKRNGLIFLLDHLQREP